MEKIFFTVICYSVIFNCYFALAGEIKNKSIFQLKIDKTASANWKSVPSNAVTVKYLPTSGMKKNGVLQFKILRPSSKPIMIVGPKINLLPCNSMTASCALLLKVRLKAKNLEDGSVELRIKIDDKNWAVPVNPVHNHKTIIYMSRANRWAGWKDETGKGKISRKAHFANIIILVKDPKGNGQIEIDSLSVSELKTENHKFRSGRLGHVFYSDSGVMTINPVRPGKIKHGKIILKNEKDITVGKKSISPELTSYRIKLPHKGFYKLVVKANYFDGTTVETVSTCAVVGKKLDEKILRESRYGIMRIYAGEKWALNTGSALNWGFWYIRNMVLDKSGNPQVSKTYPKRLRKELLMSAMHGYLPDWLRSPKAKKHGVYPPRDWQLFERTIESWAKDNMNLPDVVTTYNELDSHWRGNRQDYIRFHNVVAKAIKKARPEAVVGGPCMYSIRMDRFKKDVKMGVLKGLDCLVMHAYVHGTPPEGEFIKRIADLKKYMADIGKADMPIYLTEFGWPTNPGDWQKNVNELNQARYCARSLILCTALNIDKMIYFCGKWRGPGYSIVNPNYTPKPAYSAFCTLLRQMSKIKGGGQWLKIAPTQNWAAFRNGDNTLLALWDTVGESEIMLPEIPKKATSMTGGDVRINGRKLVITPSPVYVKISSTCFSKIKALKTACLIPGSRLYLPAEELIVPSGLKRQGDHIVIPADAVTGNYTVLLRRDKVWFCKPFKVQAPISLQVKLAKWLGGNDIPMLEIKATAKFSTQVDALVKIIFADGTKYSKKISIGPNREKLTTIALKNIHEGKRYKGKVYLEVSRPVKWQVEDKFDFTLLACPIIYHEPDKMTWKRIKEYHISNWETGSLKFPPADCSASFKLLSAPRGLYLKVKVKDDQFVQKYSWNIMWKEDSIQVAFDLDPDKPWQANNVGYGLNGHRIVEYGLGLKKGGKTMIWRYRAFVPGLKVGLPRKLMKLQQVVRDEKKSTTIYNLFIAWQSLGVEKQLPAGSRIGFSLAINEKDEGKKRRTLRLFGGITNSKDPKEYGLITFVK